jgi:2-phosphoglycolate phosphatase
MSGLILFDFDGTFADTAPDMAAAANMQRTKRGLEPLPVESLRPFVSMGARGLVKAALGFNVDHPEFETARLGFLEDYQQVMTQDTRLFDGIDTLLEHIRAANMQWGIVTNKHTYLAEPIMAFLNLPDCAVLVCGDTCAHAKPHPMPLEYAAQQVGYSAGQCAYVGDDLRDIQSARAAGIPSIAAAYGYCGEHPVDQWQADYVANTTAELWPAIEFARGLKTP